MPIYEYRCQDCQHKTSKLFRGFDAPASIECGSCNGPNTSRVISSAAFHKSLGSTLQDLDPRYDKMVDAAAANTATSDPERFIRKATPLSDANE